MASRRQSGCALTLDDRTAAQPPAAPKPRAAPDIDRRRSQAALLEVLGLLVGPLPGVPVPPLLQDPTPDPGLFGPDSITWRLAREPLLLIGGGRALLMQVAHPLVAQGVVDHSDYDTRPFDRLLGTLRWLVLVILGTSAEARAATNAITRLHERVRGRLATINATSRFTPATPYLATDPLLVRWVHATIIDSLLAAHAVLVGPLSVTDADRLVQEWERVGALLGLDPSGGWGSARALRAWIARALADGSITPVPGSRLAAHTVLQPPFPWPLLQPLAPLLAFLTIGLLPEPLRRGYGLRWTPLHRHLHAIVCAVLRAAHPYLPPRLRVTPVYAIARARIGAQ